MFRTGLLFFFAFISLLATGQKDSLKFGQAIELSYGQKFLAKKAFNGQINDLDQLKTANPISYIGLGTTGYFVINRQGEFPGQWRYDHIIPYKINVNDSISAKIGGFNFGMTLLGYDPFYYNKYVGLFFTLGFNTGRLRLKGHPLTNQKNPYFSPKVSVIPRIYLGKVYIQAAIDYDHDISSKNWRKLNTSTSPKINLPQTTSSGLTITAGIGCFFSENNPPRNTNEDTIDK